MTRITAVFDSQQHAENAIGELRRMGVADAHLSVISRHDGHASADVGSASGMMAGGAGGITPNAPLSADSASSLGTTTGAGLSALNTDVGLPGMTSGSMTADTIGGTTRDGLTPGTHTEYPTTATYAGGTLTPSNADGSPRAYPPVGETATYATDSRDTHDRPRDAADGAGKGLLAGAGIGALFGLAAAAIPGVGPFITAGALASTLGAAGGAVVGGALVGGAAGSLAGTLAQLGYTDDQARSYGDRIERGGVLVAVENGSGIADATIIDVLQRHGGHIS